MSSPQDLRYSETHEWVRIEGGQATIGITAHAAESLSDLVYIDLPPKGTEVQAGTGFGEIESVKAVSDLSSPVNGVVVEVNEALSDDLTAINADPYGKGWMIKVELSGDPPDNLLDAAAYDAHAAADAH